mmetsp:Transcript_35037/g.75601  ORF Transcript_35037/g.75601 Transcript_35037/m.75601 type:complete len:255 (+) Transcript_35037:670-1434(+)
MSRLCENLVLQHPVWDSSSRRVVHFRCYTTIKMSVPMPCGILGERQAGTGPTSTPSTCSQIMSFCRPVKGCLACSLSQAWLADSATLAPVSITFRPFHEARVAIIAASTSQCIIRPTPRRDLTCQHHPQKPQSQAAAVPWLTGLPRSRVRSSSTIQQQPARKARTGGGSAATAGSFQTSHSFQQTAQFTALPKGLAITQNLLKEPVHVPRAPQPRGLTILSSGFRAGPSTTNSPYSVLRLAHWIHRQRSAPGAG